MLNKFLRAVASALTAVLLMLAMCLVSCENGGADTSSAPDQTLSPEAGEQTTAAEVTTEDLSKIAENDIRRWRDKAIGGNWALALSAALSECDSVYLPAGTYRMSSVTVPSGKTVYGDGDDTVIYPLGTTVFEITGTVGEEIKLSEHMPDFSDTIKLTKSAGAQAGDLIYLMSQRNCTILEDCTYDWVLGRSYKSGTACFYAEFLTVAEVSDGGKTLRATTNTVFPFYRADGTQESVPRKPAGTVSDYPYMRDAATVQLVSPAHDVVIRDLKVIECKEPAIVGSWMQSCRIERVTMCSEEKSAPKAGFCLLRLSEALDCEVKDCSFLIPQKPAVSLHQKSANYGDYNIARITRSYRSGFNGCYSDFSTHAFLIGKAHKKGTSYGCYVKNCTAENSIWGGVYVSGGCYNTTITGNTVKNSGRGIVVAGRKNYIADNDVTLSLSPQTDYYYVRRESGGTAGIALIEGCSVDSVVENNRVSEATTAFLVRDGYEETNIFEYGNITIRNNTVTDCVRAVMVYRHELNVGEKPFTLTVVDNDLSGGAPGTRFAGQTSIVLDPETTGAVISGNRLTNFTSVLYPAH